MLLFTSRAGETVVMQAVQNGTIGTLPNGFWIFKSVMASIFTLYALIHFSIFTDGYLSTCRQYRITLEKHLGLHGTLIPVIQSRLSCSSIFDFMDYIQPDSGNAYRSFMNTAADLNIGIVVSFFAFVMFFYAAGLNIIQARRKR